MTIELTIPEVDDFHVHLRYDERMNITVPLLRKAGVGRVLAMPNTIPALLSSQDASTYHKKLKSISSDVKYLLSIKLSPNTSEATIKDAVKSGILIGKQYPAGVTTNSEDGISDIKSMYQVYEFMQKYGLPLSIHAEMPNTDVLNAETAFLPLISTLANDFPNLKIIVEHISTQSAINLIESLPDNVAGTITIHHMLFTLQDIIASKMNPHLYCMPILKTEKDKRAILKKVKSGSPKFFFGSDSAPHFKKDKENATISPGIFSSPIILPLLAYIFEKENMLDKLEHFTSKFGAEFYNLARNKRKVTLSNKFETKIPSHYTNIVPIMAGKTIPWSLLSF